MPKPARCRWEGIGDSGVISDAGRRVKWSDKRAGRLVDTSDRGCATPLVDAATGGKAGGGASVTPLGEEVLARFRRMEAAAAKACAADLKALQGKLAKS